MKTPAKVALLLVAGLLPFAAQGSPADDAKLKLKPGAHGKVCLGCHSDFADKLKLPSVHTPVKAGECDDCHRPHASDHGKMLDEAPDKICASCHADIVPKDAKSVHKAVVESGCTTCHDPHASENKKNLLQAGNALCLTCHSEIGDAIEKAQFKHPPVQSSCLTCHDPHASTKSEFLLVKDQSALCGSCHKTDQPAFVKVHAGYPVGRGRCTSCHDPHGSSNKSILWATVHPPVAAKQCGQCHNDPGAANALQPKRQGVETCRPCHGEVLNQVLAAKRVHWPVTDRVGCLNCHGPHATKEAKLVKAPLKKTCGACHADTIRRQEKSETKHPPVDAGNCAACHQPHGSDNAFLFAQSSVVQMCGSCHDWQKHSGHPLGEKAVDPRNKTLTVDCESCHRSHGTPFKHFTHGDYKSALCVNCHQNLRR